MEAMKKLLDLKQQRERALEQKLVEQKLDAQLKMLEALANSNPPWPRTLPAAPGTSLAQAIFTSEVLDVETTPPIELRELPLPVACDLYMVARTLPLMPEQSWLAGGCVRRHLEGYDIFEGDFDVYCKNPTEAQAFGQRMTRIASLNEGVEAIDAPKGTRVWTFKTGTKEELMNWRVQLIEHHTFNTVEECLQSFDFTINQGAVTVSTVEDTYFGSTRLQPKLFVGPDTENAIKARQLKAVQPRSLFTILKRLQKFVQYGYYLPQDEMKRIAKMMGQECPGEDEYV